MARQVLENGVILPAEYSDDWYDDMTSNLTKLDDVIGSDSEKLSSADVGAAALSNNYNDLDNLPTIPTVNDATLTIQKNGVDVQTFTANASSNVTANITVPTKTSDLTNDSNFVDTSNSAVSSGITSAKVTAYDTHIADTDIHVTTADKTKWNNGVSQAYVFRYSSTALVASSTNSNTLLDNTDNLKVGDKVIDSSGVLFSITAIDTANSNFSIGTALVDLADDSDVVHKSGDETVGGEKTFNDLQIIGYGTQYKGARNAYILPEFTAGYSGLSITTLSLSQAVKIGNFVLDANNKPSLDTSKGYIQFATGENNGVNTCILEPKNSTSSLGTSVNRWSKIYGTEYYYGSNNVEFSTKFVTTDTNQTVSGKKTFSDDLTIYNYDSSQITKNLNIASSKIQVGDTSKSDAFGIRFNAGASYVAQILAVNDTTGTQNLQFSVRTKNSSDNFITSMVRSRLSANGNSSFEPGTNDSISLGSSSYKYKDLYTNKINALEPSSLSLPSDNLNDIIDISSYLSVLDGSNANTYIAPANGWISITMSNCSGIQAYITGLWGHQIVRPTVGGVRFFMPVLKNKTINILIFGGTIDNARFIPCQGNV